MSLALYKPDALLRQLPPQIRREFEEEMERQGEYIKEHYCHTLHDMIQCTIDFSISMRGEEYWDAVYARLNAIWIANGYEDWLP